MTELLAFLTVIFVVYSLYEVFKTACQSGDETQLATGAPYKVEPASPSVDKPTAAPASQAAPAAEAHPKQASPHAEPEKIVHLKDPKTGEVSPVPSNYRFAKKWIKEALVTEGLLKKVYKNSELTEAVNSKAKEALDQFKKLGQYHA